MNRRRDLLFLLGAAALAPRKLLAQSKPPVVIGWLSSGSRETSNRSFAAFKEALAELGWKVGANMVIEERWADARRELLQSMAQDIAAKRPAIIVGATVLSAAAATKAAPGIPIVVIGVDPVGAGLAASYARPGGMVTGFTTASDEVQEKNLELLLAAVPKLRRVGFLLDAAASASGLYQENVRRSVARHSVEARIAAVTRPEEVEPALLRLKKEGAQALIVMSSTGLNVERQRIVKFALAQRWPVIGSGAYAAEGALLGYGADNVAIYRRAAHYVDRILKGAKPADLPIERPAKFELVINMKTARALKLEIPRDLAVRADRVIE